jgi:uncharacterized membrane protein YagU involved in acid resistance
MQETVRRGVVPGAVAGLVGGVVFGVSMASLGTLDSIATIVRSSPSSGVGWLVHMTIATIVGIGFGLVVRRQRLGVGETLAWGLAYGACFWFIGPLTIRPVITGGSIAWTVPAAQGVFSSLVGHLLYGAAAALTFVALRAREAGALRPTRGGLVRGAIAGLAAAALLTGPVPAGHELITPWTAVAEGSAAERWAATLGLGLVAGLAYAVLYPRLVWSAGASLVRGAVYGFFWWLVGALTLLPVLDGRGLLWFYPDARASFVTFTDYLLFGVTLAVLYHWLDALVRGLLADVAVLHDRESAGAQGMRALGRGTLAGLVGGLLFTPIWLHADFFPTVAKIVGGSSTATGILLHLVFAVLIGASYGVLFRRQSFDLGSAIGWGAAYGFCWWNLGSLTLLPTFIGAPLRWDADAAAGAFPGLVGHLVYGTSLGVAYYLLEARHNPWWVARTEAEAARRERSREQVLTSAPALWTLVVLIAVTIPVLLGTAPKPGQPVPPGYGSAAKTAPP